jgi:tetratricopeptide (TPR) repeat protein
MAAPEPPRKLELRGEIVPHRMAAVSLHATQTPYSDSTVSGLDGRFRFKSLDPGSYTVAIFVPRRGEQRLTVTVTSSRADKKGRVQLVVRLDDALLSRDRVANVSARELAVPAAARREYSEANKCLTKRDVGGAIAHLKKAVDIEPRFGAAWNHLGTIAYQTQRYTDAENYFREAIQADPEIYEPVVNLGGVLLNLGNLDEAWKYNVEAVMRKPADALAHAQLGMTYLALNKLPLAEKHLLEARRLDPAHFSNPQLHLAEVYIRKNDRDRATEQLEEFLRYHPDWPQAAKMRATIELWRSASRTAEPQPGPRE